ncbi:Uncharacterised protein [uncultured archaeon]|nr:Uncharacterised protein [uncultured archaeon]
MNKKLFGIAAVILAALFIFGCTQNTQSGADQVKAEINSTWVEDSVNSGTTVDTSSTTAGPTSTWVDSGEVTIGSMI